MTTLPLAVLVLVLVLVAWWQVEMLWAVLTAPLRAVRSILWWRRDRAERRSDAALAAMQSDVQK